MSSSIRQVKVNEELPHNIPKVLKEKFEAHDLKPEGETVSSNRLTVDNSASKTKKTKKKKNDHVDRKAASNPISEFSYPNRRPAHDPVWIGEKLIYDISYLGISAGDFTLEALQFQKISERKAYHFRGTAITSSLFSIFYRLHDVVESYMDYEGSFSHRFHLELDESKQTRSTLELNDSERRLTHYWNYWHPKDGPLRETNETGSIEPFSQDTLSALYYLRMVPLEVGSVVSFFVVSEGKTWEAICNIVRREQIKTPLGRLWTIVIQPDTKFQGILKKNGDSFIWLTDDERRFPVRLEAKVKIGAVVAKLKEVQLGSPSLMKNMVNSATPAYDSDARKF